MQTMCDLNRDRLLPFADLDRDCLLTSVNMYGSPPCAHSILVLGHDCTKNLSTLFMTQQVLVFLCGAGATQGPHVL